MADGFDIYQDIATRTDGDIYIGVVGPVRTGKSTFIKNFMDMLIIPNITNSNQKARTVDELPQSSGGRTIMTTEPKFVPNKAVDVQLDNNVHFRSIMVDCVGYMVPTAQGHLEDDHERMVKTPWFSEDIPFTRAAELGTRKVIEDHATVGIVVTTDGSITDINRSDYVEAEERVIKELKSIDKPFVVVLNTSRPYADDTIALNRQLKEKYDVPVLTMDCKQMRMDDIHDLTSNLLQEFPLKEINIKLPKWTESLELDHWLKKDLMTLVKDGMEGIVKLRDIEDYADGFNQSDHIKKVHLDKINMSNGVSDIEVALEDHLFYDVLSETTGIEINSEHKLISLIRKLAQAKTEYDKVAFALSDVMQKGYGVVNPMLNELKLDSPEVIKQGGSYGVKFKASAPSIHLIRADVQAEVAPIVGTEEQSKEFMATVISQLEDDPDAVWATEFFGRSLESLVTEGLQNKLYKMPDEAQGKLQETLQRLINENSNGLICILL